MLDLKGQEGFTREKRSGVRTGKGELQTLGLQGGGDQVHPKTGELGHFLGSPLTSQSPGRPPGLPPGYRLGKRLTGLEFPLGASTRNPKSPALNSHA